MLNSIQIDSLDPSKTKSVIKKTYNFLKNIFSDNDWNYTYNDLLKSSVYISFWTYKLLLNATDTSWEFNNFVRNNKLKKNNYNIIKLEKILNNELFFWLFTLIINHQRNILPIKNLDDIKVIKNMTYLKEIFIPEILKNDDNIINNDSENKLYNSLNKILNISLLKYKFLIKKYSKSALIWNEEYNKKLWDSLEKINNYKDFLKLQEKINKIDSNDDKIAFIKFISEQIKWIKDYCKNDTNNNCNWNTEQIINDYLDNIKNLEKPLLYFSDLLKFLTNEKLAYLPYVVWDYSNNTNTKEDAWDEIWLELESEFNISYKE